MNRLHYDIGFGWGMAACQVKAKRVPAADSRVMDFIKEKCKEPGSSIPLLRGWVDGYAWQIDQDMKAAGGHLSTEPDELNSIGPGTIRRRGRDHQQ